MRGRGRKCFQCNKEGRRNAMKLLRNRRKIQKQRKKAALYGNGGHNTTFGLRLIGLTAACRWGHTSRSFGIYRCDSSRTELFGSAKSKVIQTWRPLVFTGDSDQSPLHPLNRWGRAVVTIGPEKKPIEPLADPWRSSITWCCVKSCIGQKVRKCRSPSKKPPQTLSGSRTQAQIASCRRRKNTCNWPLPWEPAKIGGETCSEQSATPAPYYWNARPRHALWKTFLRKPRSSERRFHEC